MVIVGELARRVYESLRREAASLRIQTNVRMHIARKAYKVLWASAISIQTGLRGMAARNELRFRRQTKAAIIIQVSIQYLKDKSVFFFFLLQMVGLRICISGVQFHDLQDYG